MTMTTASSISTKPSCFRVRRSASSRSRRTSSDRAVACRIYRAGPTLGSSTFGRSCNDLAGRHDGTFGPGVAKRVLILASELERLVPSSLTAASAPAIALRYTTQMPTPAPGTSYWGRRSALEPIRVVSRLRRSGAVVERISAQPLSHALVLRQRSSDTELGSSAGIRWGDRRRGDPGRSSDYLAPPTPAGRRRSPRDDTGSSDHRSRRDWSAPSSHTTGVDLLPFVGGTEGPTRGVGAADWRGHSIGDCEWRDTGCMPEVAPDAAHSRIEPGSLRDLQCIRPKARPSS
jgi:hypothetical protein